MRCYVLCWQRPWLADAGNDGRVGETAERNILEDVVLFLPVHVFRNRWRMRGFGMRLVGLPNHHQAFRLRIRQGPVQKRVQHAENRAVRGDTQGEGENYYGEKAGTLAQAALHEFHVSPESLEQL